MGLAQTGVAVDEKGVIALRRLLRHGLGRRIGQLVLGTHHVCLKRKGVGVKQVPGLIRRHTVVGGQLLVVEDLDLQIGGKNVLQRRLDLGKKAGLHRVFFKGVAAMEHQRRILHGDHGDLIEPGPYGGVGQLAAETAEDAVPKV